MPRYFFDVEDHQVFRDRDGLDFDSPHAARRAASFFAGELLREAPDQLWQDGDWRVRVKGEDGQVLFSILLAAVPMPTGRELARAEAARTRPAFAEPDRPVAERATSAAPDGADVKRAG